jgi:hypothetical protein
MEEDKKVSVMQAFEKSAKSTSMIFYNAVKQMLTEANDGGPNVKHNHTIFIDTNLPTYGIDKAIADI